MKRFKIISTDSAVPEYIVGEINRSENIGGIQVEINSVEKVYNFFFFYVIIKGLATYYWKPLASIFEGKNKEEYSKKWYKITEPITNYSLDIFEGRLQIKETYEHSFQETYLLLNNIIKK